MSSKEIRSGIMAASRTDTAGSPALPGRRTAPVERKVPIKPDLSKKSLVDEVIDAGGKAARWTTLASLIANAPFSMQALIQNNLEEGMGLSPQAIVRSVQEGPSTFGKDINALFDLLRPKAPETTPTPVDKAFPYTLDASSFVPITQEQAVEKMKETNIADVENFTIKMFLPFDKETLDASPNLKYDQVQKAVIPSYLDEALRKRLEEVKNSTQFDVLADGAPVYATESGKLRVASIAGQKEENEAGSYTPAYSMVRIDFVDSAGKSASVIISVFGGIPLFDLTQAAWDSNGIDVHVGQPLFKISKEKAVGGRAVAGQRGQVVINAFYMQENPPTSIPNFTVPKLPMPLKIDFLKEIIVE